MARMKLKKLEEYLQSVDGFENPKVNLEQYPTPPHIASCMIYNIQSRYEDIEGKFVGDLGCGCGMLSIGSFLLGANLTIGFEIDESAIETFRSNVFEMEIPGVDCIQSDVLHLESFSKWNNAFDTVVMNPPFGTKNNSGMDMRFLQTGIELASNSVYSLHKTSTREYINKKAKEWGVKSEVVAELRYNIESSYKFHKKQSVDIDVDFWRFDVINKQ
ncbi:rRNA N6-adenosine-methyltransferase Mettl5 [Eupeodes corollae]|uniref:rRNA N6-adenosine-methyltransferase Mettl5 n=1 Tax=Eupeodes corollae TaxID=290404 RepID=UPI0024908868|nr:rRNA N6-adenosine-methyltransferase Mettl5 [Eupeodes corollae]